MNLANGRNELAERFAQQLEQLSTANHCGAGLLNLQSAAVLLHCRIRSTGRLACEVESIRVASERSITATPSQLESLANSLTHTISYLDEPLVLLEKMDTTMQVRSEVPQLNDEGYPEYFELVLMNTGITLQRFQKQPGERRQAVPFTLTKKTLGRLCWDLLAAFDDHLPS